MLLDTLTHLVTTSADLLPALVPADPKMPDIEASYDFPVMTLINRVVSWILGGGTVLCFAGFILGLIAIGTRGFGSERIRSIANAGTGWALGAAMALGASTGIYNFFVGLDLGF